MGVVLSALLRGGGVVSHFLLSRSNSELLLSKMILRLLSEGMALGTCVVRCGRLGHSVLLPRYISSGAVKQQVNTAAAVEGSLELAAARPTHEIPGPRVYPIVGTLPEMMFNKSFDARALHKIWADIVKQYGPIVKIQQPGIDNLVALTNPDDCQTLMRATMDNPMRIAFLSLKKIRMETVDDYFEKKGGILVENGDEWWRVRSRVQKPMMRAKNVTSYLASMDEVVLNFMDRIAAMQEEFGEMPSNFQFELYKWALESVGLVALNRRLGCLEPSIQKDSEPMRLITIVNEIFDLLNDTEMNFPYWKIFPTPSFRKLKKRHQDFLELADQNIRETELALLAKTATDTDELSLMETLLLSPGLSRKDVITLILDMLFAGIDTTSHTLGFTLYLLARNPNAQVKLQKEVDGVLGDLQGPITAKHLAQFSYLKAVIKESFRLYPLTLGTARTLERDLVLGGYVVPKGWMGTTLNMLMGWDEALFPRAKEFIPERWLRHKPLGPIHPYASLPFGTGTRMCIGRRIAEQEMYTFLARVMHRFNVDYKYEDIDLVSKLVYMPSKPLKFSFTERK
ncbi:probable cytochrome P450 49a1 isoform X1 [Cherax quadricarinatus]